MDYSRSGVRPWDASEFGGPDGMLDFFAKVGKPYRRGGFEGYNEIVVESRTWLANLPRSIEAIFLVECRSSDGNLQCCGGGAGGTGTALNCQQAQERARAMHAKFIDEYGIDARKFPLIKLRPTKWDQPFVVESGGGLPAMQWDEWERLVQAAHPTT